MCSHFLCDQHVPASRVGGSWLATALNPALVLANLIVFQCTRKSWIYLLGHAIGAPDAPPSRVLHCERHGCRCARCRTCDATAQGQSEVCLCCLVVQKNTSCARTSSSHEVIVKQCCGPLKESSWGTYNWAASICWQHGMRQHLTADTSLHEVYLVRMI